MAGTAASGKRRRRPETVEERRERKKEEARVRRERLTVETLAKSREECEKNPFICIVGDKKQDDRINNPAGESSGRQNAPWPSHFRGAKTAFSAHSIQLPPRPPSQQHQAWRRPGREVSTSSESVDAVELSPEVRKSPVRQLRISRHSSSDAPFDETSDSLIDDLVDEPTGPSSAASDGREPRRHGRHHQQRHRITTPSDEVEVQRNRESSIPEIAGLNIRDGSRTPPTVAKEPLPLDASDGESGSRYTPSQGSESNEGSDDVNFGFSLNSPPRTPSDTSSALVPEHSPPEPVHSHISLLSSPGPESEDSGFLRWAGYTPATTARQPSNNAINPVMSRYIQAILRQETAGGPDFLAAQAKVYDLIFQKIFGLECDCPEPEEFKEPQDTHTLTERTRYLQRSLPRLSDVFGNTGSYDPRAYFHRWSEFLSHRPTEPLSFRKTQASLSQRSAEIGKKHDIDSCWVSPTDMMAILPPNDFRLTFLPRFSLNLSTDQVVQPHGLDLARTRHIALGSFQAGSVRFQVLVFFPKSAESPQSMTSASSNSLSLERQKDLYDNIIIPAAYETIDDPERQEIPRSFDIVYAKSHIYQEKPSAGRSDNDNSAHQLAFTVPASDLGRFWKSFVEKADRVRVKTQRGEDVPYFQRPRLLFQAHDLKNTFARTSLHETLSQFQDTVMAALNPDYLDMHSCWVDVGARYYVTGTDGRPLAKSDAYTLEWKSQCNDRLHKRLERIAPDSKLAAAYYRSFALRDVGNLVSKAKRTREPNIGHPDSRALGISRFKAYDCGKDLFKSIRNDYCPFNSPSLPQLALDQNMIQDLDSMTKSRANTYTTQRNRDSIGCAWEANKRHIKAISDPQALTNYGIRKEATFRLDTILTMWSDGYFDPERSPHVGPVRLTVPLDPGPDEHYPNLHSKAYWLQTWVWTGVRWSELFHLIH